MIEKHLLITFLRENVSKLGIDLEGVDIFLFGSFGNSPSALDVDLLLIYDEKKVSISEILEVRRKLYLNQKKISILPLDISILNVTEEHETNFVRTEKAIKLL